MHSAPRIALSDLNVCGGENEGTEWRTAQEKEKRSIKRSTQIPPRFAGRAYK